MDYHITGPTLGPIDPLTTDFIPECMDPRATGLLLGMKALDGQFYTRMYGTRGHAVTVALL